MAEIHIFHIHQRTFSRGGPRDGSDVLIGVAVARSEADALSLVPEGETLKDEDWPGVWPLRAVSVAEGTVDGMGVGQFVNKFWSSTPARKP